MSRKGLPHPERLMSLDQIPRCSKEGTHFHISLKYLASTPEANSQREKPKPVGIAFTGLVVSKSGSGLY